MNTEKREYRSYEFQIERRSKKDYTVRGYATTFGNEYRLYAGSDYEVREIIAASALKETDLSNVIMQYNHEGRVFARTTNKTLKLKVNAIGLYIEAYLGGTEEGRKLYEEIAEGYTDKMSIGMRVDTDFDVWTQYKEGDKVIEVRTINKIEELFDVSAVSIPANNKTTIKA